MSYILNDVGLYYCLRARFNNRDFTPNKKFPKGVKGYIYKVWLKDKPYVVKKLVIWYEWGNSLTSLAIRDKVCIDELFSFNNYDKIKHKKVELW